MDEPVEDDAGAMEAPPVEAVEDDSADGADEADEAEPEFVLDPDLEANRGGPPPIRYRGGDYVPGIPTRADLVAASAPAELRASLERLVAEGRPVLFLPNSLEETNEYVGGEPVYVVRLFGVLPDGAKTEVVLVPDCVFFDVRVPAGATAAATEARLRHLFNEAGCPARYRTVGAFPVRGYHTAPVEWVRVEHGNLQQRKKALAAARASGFETASDDRSVYIRKLARENGLTLSDWASLLEYEYAPGPTAKSPLCAHVFRVRVPAYRSLVDVMGTPEARAKATKLRQGNPHLSRDRTLVLTWDIETRSRRRTGDVPRAEHPEDDMFMLAVTAHWKDDPTPLAAVCIVDVDTAPDKRWTTIVCDSPKDVVKAAALVFQALAPDIMTGFNDSDYDWPFFVEKARQFDVLDWVWDHMTAAPRRQTTTESVLKWNYQRGQRVKISAEATVFCSYLKVPGCVMIDTRVCFRRIFSKAETSKQGSLRFYLGVCGLPSKADMPYQRMWNYHITACEIRDRDAAGKASETTPEAREQSREHMRHVANYCIIDALSCQRLLLRRNILNDFREVASLAFISLNDTHYYAGGMKVCNLLGAYATRRGMLVSMIPVEQTESGKYTGAYVFPPHRGLSPDPGLVAQIEEASAGLRRCRDAGDEAGVAAARQRLCQLFVAFGPYRPITGLDFASLYPSIIMAYNLSPETILLTEEQAVAVSRDRKLHPIEFQYNGRLRRAWSVRHDNVAERYGLFPSVLDNLFMKRAEVKKILKRYGAFKERYELVTGRAARDRVPLRRAAEALREEAAAEAAHARAALAPGAPPPPISPGSTLADELADFKRVLANADELVKGLDELIRIGDGEDGGGSATAVPEFDTRVERAYVNACYEWDCANTKQLALKVYMNTFYGETGNPLSPYFLLFLAAGVTSAGQYNLQLVARFIRDEKGFFVKYGDTDSLYLVCPAEYFTECDEDFVQGRFTREEWFTAMVRITMRVMNLAREEVNARLAADNGTPRLTMAYEEVLFPAVLVGKKKYWGIPHENEINFRPRKLFVRGIDTVKQGQFNLFVTVGTRIMWRCVALDNRLSISAIAEDVLRDAVVNHAQWDMKDFIKSDAWKPDKKNNAVQRFMARTRAAHAVERAVRERDIAEGRPPKPYLYEIPDPGERFQWMIVKTANGTFNMRGTKNKVNKGDLMQYVHVVKALGLEVDVAYYLLSYVVGLCARFVCSDPQFQPPNDPRNPLTEKQIDAKSQASAKKALELFVKSLADPDTPLMKKRGYAYRRAFTRAAVEARDALVEAVGDTGAELLHGSWLGFELFLDDDETAADDVARITEMLVGTAKSFVAATFPPEVLTAEVYLPAAAELGMDARGADTGQGLLAASGLGFRGSGTRTPGGTRTLYTLAAGRQRGPGRPREGLWLLAALERREAAARAALAALAPQMVDLATRYEADLERLVDLARLAEHRADPAQIGAPPPALVSSVAATEVAATEVAATEPPAVPVEASAEASVEATTAPEQPRHLLAVTPADRALLQQFHALWYDLVGVYFARAQELGWARWIADLKAQRISAVGAAAPTAAARRQIIAGAAAKIPLMGL